MQQQKKRKSPSVPTQDQGLKKQHRPMPADPKELARAVFRQADQKMFGGRKKKGEEHL